MLAGFHQLDLIAKLYNVVIKYPFEVVSREPQMSKNVLHVYTIWIKTYRPLRYERVYLPLNKVADTPFHIQGDDMSLCTKCSAYFSLQMFHVWRTNRPLGVM